MSKESVSLSEEAIIAIASNPETSPINIFSDHPSIKEMTGGEARERAILFARAIEKAVLENIDKTTSKQSVPKPAESTYVDVEPALFVKYVQEHHVGKDIPNKEGTYLLGLFHLKMMSSNGVISKTMEIRVHVNYEGIIKNITVVNDIEGRVDHHGVTVKLKNERDWILYGGPHAQFMFAD